MRYRLGDICRIVKGETGIMKAVPGEYTMVTLGEIDKTHNEFQFDTKAVIIPLVSSTGHGHASMKRVKYQDGKFALGNILCAVIPKDENFVLAKYLHIFLHWNREELLVSQMKGMANVSLPMNKIADVIIIVPSLEKQKEIVELEKQLNEKESSVQKLYTNQLTLIENLNQAILQEGVQGKLVPQDPTDEPASDLLKRIKEEKDELIKNKKIKQGKLQTAEVLEDLIFKIPETWKWCSLDDICYNITDGTHQTPSYTKSGRIFLSAQNIKPFRFMPEEHKYVSEEAYQDYIKNRKNQKGDILIARVGAGIGEAAVIDREIEFCFYVSLGLIQPFKDYIDSRYLTYIINSRFGIRYAKGNISSQGAAGNFNLGRIRSFPIPLPPLSEQKRIVAEIENQLEKTKQLKAHVLANQVATEQLLKALLQEAFAVEGK